MKKTIKQGPVTTGAPIEVCIPLFNVSVSKVTDSSYRPHHIYFNDVKSLKHWFVSLSEDYIKIHDIVLTYE